MQITEGNAIDGQSIYIGHACPPYVLCCETGWCYSIFSLLLLLFFLEGIKKFGITEVHYI